MNINQAANHGYDPAQIEYRPTNSLMIFLAVISSFVSHIMSVILVVILAFANYASKLWWTCEVFGEYKNFVDYPVK